MDDARLFVFKNMQQQPSWMALAMTPNIVSAAF